MNIKELRKKTNLSQKAFGEDLGLSPQSILNYEAGSNVPESINKLIRYVFAKYLPEEEALIKGNMNGIQEPYENTVLKQIEKKNESLLQRVHELENDKKMLTNYIKSLEHQLGIDNDNQQTA